MEASKTIQISSMQTIHGLARVHHSTKQLLSDIEPFCIAVIYHQDLDELAAEGLIAAKAQAVINIGQIMTGTVPVTGPLMLIENNIPIYEMEAVWASAIKDNTPIKITCEGVVVGKLTVPCTPFTKDKWLDLYSHAHDSYHERLLNFINNTLDYANREKDLVLKPLYCPDLEASLEGRHALVVIRGKGYKQDLAALKDYIRRYKPVLIGVDGGADALLEQGHKPDLIIGDMDSATDQALQCGAELLVHAYSNGYAPGLKRLEHLGLNAKQLSASGTSEDIALLLAYDHQCERIVTVGAHSHMFDFLEKGRKGMGSTVLVRMKIGSKLTDAKGIALLYGPTQHYSLISQWSYALKNGIRKLLLRFK
ncbi:putative cytokinetic ring protein SteA [Paenibacillus sp. UNC451MF]|uniref:putative cytokinetic ring protein SteA n=1 Tax=Paenibacillus sp. UNC451MF TaxID=1449063 RepID=UPI0018CC0815|nr:putative cytokinetic ring protein SteA [Paenibacillus sp. UNC451MF]